MFTCQTLEQRFKDIERSVQAQTEYIHKIDRKLEEIKKDHSEHKQSHVLNGWKCPLCNVVHSPFDSVCRCGVNYTITCTSATK